MEFDSLRSNSYYAPFKFYLNLICHPSQNRNSPNLLLTKMVVFLSTEYLISPFVYLQIIFNQSAHF
jgi:hypothetical protein